MDSFVIRYRKGTIHYVDLNPIEQFRKNLDLLELEPKSRAARIEQINDGSGWGVAIHATWAQLIHELIEEFERLAGHSKEWQSIIHEYLVMICSDKPANLIWKDLKRFIHEHIETLSGWQWRV